MALQEQESGIGAPAGCIATYNREALSPFLVLAGPESTEYKRRGYGRSAH